MKKLLLLVILFSLGLVVSTKAVDYYDIMGNKIFTGQDLFIFSGATSEQGGWNGVYGNNWVDWDRFLNNFGSQVSLYEKINNYDVELVLGRTPVTFTPLTFNMSRYRWGYPSMHAWDWAGGKYYNNWAWDWGKWWEQRGIKLRLKDGDKEWLAVIEKTADKGSDDEAEWRDSRWQAEAINKDRYLLGFRHSLMFLGQKVGMSFVNQFDTRYLSSKKTLLGMINDNELFAGDTPTNRMSKLYVRVSPESPRTGGTSTASVYAIGTYVNDVYIPALSVLKGNQVGSGNVTLAGFGDVKSDRLDVSGESKNVVYSFAISSVIPADQISSVVFHFDVANDYRIETSSDGVNYHTIYRAPGEVNNSANRQVLVYRYTEASAHSIMGFDMTGTIPGIGVSYKGEFGTLVDYMRIPRNSDFLEQIKNYAGYINLSKEISPFLLTASYHNIGWNYDASFSVEDNDDSDEYPDIVDQYVAWKDGYDMDEKDGPDYDEDFLLFFNDRGFRDGMDLNNNSAYDHEENDNRPDYPDKWQAGRAGFNYGIAYKPSALFKDEVIYIDEVETTSLARNRTIYNKLLFKPTLDFVSIVFKNETKRTWDNLPDSLVFNPETPSPYADQRVSSYIDPLNFQDNLVNNSYVTFSWKLLKRVVLITRYSFGMDWRYFSDENYNSHLGIARVNVKDWYPLAKLGIMKKLQFIPLAKVERSYQNMNTPTTGDADTESWMQYAGGLMLLEKLTPKTIFTIAGEYKNRTDYFNNVRFERQVFQIEVNHTDQFYGRPIHISMGMKDTDQSSVDDPSMKEIFTQYFLKAYFQW